jgi:hypothetical protein
VFSGVRRARGVQGLRVIIQSDRPPQYVDDRVEAFLHHMDVSCLVNATVVVRGLLWGSALDETAIMEVPCHSRCCTLKIPSCSKTLSSEHRPKFCTIHHQS